MMIKLNRNNCELTCSVLLFILGAMLFIYRRQWILAQTHPLDYDGFYYLQEIRSYALHGRGYYHEEPQLYFQFISKLASLFSLGPVQAFNLSVVLSLLIFATAVALLSWKTGSELLSSGLFVAVMQSEALFFLHYGFLKQSLGTALVVIAYAAIVRLTEGGSSKWAYVLSFLALFIGASMHLFSLVLALGLIALWIGEQLSKHGRLISWSPIALILFGLAIILVKRFPAELRLEYELPWDWERTRGWLSDLEVFQYRYSAVLVSLIGAVAAICCLNNRALWGMMLLWFSLNAPIWRHEGVCNRWLISSVSIFFILLALFAREGSARIASRNHRAVALFLLILFILSPALFRRTPRPVGPDMPISLIEQNARPLTNWISPEAVVVAPHGIQYRISYFLNRAAFKVKPANQRTSYFKLHRKQRYKQQCFRLREGIDKVPSGTSCVELGSGWVLSRLAE